MQMQKSRKKKLLEGGEIDAMDDSSQTSDSRVNVMDPKTGEVSKTITIQYIDFSVWLVKQFELKI